MTTSLKTFFIIAIVLFSANCFSQTLTINEFVSSNTSGIQDFEGDFSDWIEIYNPGQDSINLQNYTVSDNEENLGKWSFPSVSIPPQGFALVFASGKDTVLDNELHTNFKIKQDGERLYLSELGGQLLFSTDSVSVPANYSYGSLPDGTSEFQLFANPTPGETNVVQGHVFASHPTGFYTDPFDLNLSTADPAQTIRFTLDGSVPTINSQAYNDDLLISNANFRPNFISTIPTTPLVGPAQLFDFIWKEPNDVYKASVIRYAAFDQQERQGPVYTRTYFVDPSIKSRYRFPILSLVTDSLNLFHHDTGIYIPGRSFEESGWNYWPIGNYHNRGSEWERRVHIDYLENDGRLGFETDAGIRMRGYGSPSFPQKSFTVYLRNEYGLKNVAYPIFPESNTEKFKRIILRNGGNDFVKSHFKDAVLQSILKPTGLELQDSRPSIVFINGEYWGVHNIREKYDRFYFKYRFGIDEDDINVLGVCGSLEEGSNQDYYELTDFISNHDLSEDVNYQYVESKVDMENFIDFQIAEIFYANYDWPCNNYKMWKSNDPDSKWRFLLYDLDVSFGFGEDAEYNTASLDHATSEEEEWPYCTCSNVLFRSVLKNDQFVSQFIDRFVYHLNNTFSARNMLDEIDRFEKLFFPEIDEHILRWGHPVTTAQWVAEIDEMRAFAKKRPCFMQEHLKSFFQLPELNFECETFPDSEVSELRIFPNPSSGVGITVEHNDRSLLAGEYRVVNLQGKTVLEGEVFDYRLRLDLLGLASGVYVLHLNTDQKTYRSKLVISK